MLQIMETTLNGMSKKDEQDLHLQRLIEKEDVSRKRWKILLLKKVNVALRSSMCFENCVVFEFKVHDVTHKRVYHLLTLSKQGKSPRDLRGKLSSATAISGDVFRQIHDHISSFTSSHHITREKK
ncbi:hypothetical protein PR048_006214 [Dryococelus australis]|uniref:Uncharacterized protein n=1 Tax=Dryococelus australis TaxID=614101 RepID=A0ABQ9IAB9_9NEOP|nr:hypothetical protein PR048_006214 [Dryococelus australis]